MRELKFRAFDTENKTWTFVTLGDLICGACTENGDKPLSGAKQVWEQSTGLKDKNGLDIYEGDIVQIDDHILGDFEVVWHGLGWMIKRAVGYETLAVHKSQDCTIIGNIHENPELLEGKK